MQILQEVLKKMLWEEKPIPLGLKFNKFDEVRPIW